MVRAFKCDICDQFFVGGSASHTVTKEVPVGSRNYKATLTIEHGGDNWPDFCVSCRAILIEAFGNKNLPEIG